MFNDYDVRRALAGCANNTYADCWCVEYIYTAILVDCGYYSIYLDAPANTSRGSFVSYRVHDSRWEPAFDIHIGAYDTGAGYTGYYDITT